MLLIGGPLLSRLHRRAESLDEACLRAYGHPHDYEIREELLSALEWDETFHPKHARPVIRDLFEQVHHHSTELAKRIRSGADAHPIADGIQSLRLRLAAFQQALGARHSET